MRGVAQPNEIYKFSIKYLHYYVLLLQSLKDQDDVVEVILVPLDQGSVSIVSAGAICSRLFLKPVL